MERPNIPSDEVPPKHEYIPPDQFPILGPEHVDSSNPFEARHEVPNPDLHALRKPRRITLPIVLFVATCFSTFFAGAMNWDWQQTLMQIGQDSQLLSLPGSDDDTMAYRRAILRNSSALQGLLYMSCVLAILLTHEMGHFLATLIYRVPASFPFFIPFPISPFGTMGAVIGMEGFKANRRQMFDIGLAGPLAGLVVAIPILWLGIERLDFSVIRSGSYAFDCPLIVRIMMRFIKPEVHGVTSIALSQLNPYFMAGWVGLLITGLNMMPISQLDGGHVIYTLFGRKAHGIARGFLLFAIVYSVFYAPIWIVMVILVTLIGTDHPPTSNDSIPLGRFRTGLGLISLFIPILCFPPTGLIM